VIDDSHLATHIDDELVHIRLLPQKARSRILHHAAIYVIGIPERPEGAEENGPKSVSLCGLQRDRAPLPVGMDPMRIARRMPAMPSTESPTWMADGCFDDACR
jgi:hypothetical protein